jgi:hypothetical protein
MPVTKRIIFVLVQEVFFFFEKFTTFILGCVVKYLHITISSKIRTHKNKTKNDFQINRVKCIAKTLAFKNKLSEHIAEFVKR